jgi:hypothetical protein
VHLRHATLTVIISLLVLGALVMGRSEAAALKCGNNIARNANTQALMFRNCGANTVHLKANIKKFPFGFADGGCKSIGPHRVVTLAVMAWSSTGGPVIVGSKAC